MKRFVAVALVVAIGGFVGGVRAADKDKLSGTWKWSVNVNGQERETTLKLKVDGDKVTGSISGRNNTENKIEDGKFKDGKVSFKVTVERNNQKFTREFEGKLDGDSIKGKIKSERNGQAQERDWEAKRSAS